MLRLIFFFVAALGLRAGSAHGCPTSARGLGLSGAAEGRTRQASDDDVRAALRRLRKAFKNEGRERARELLREVIAKLGEPERDERADHLEFLFDLDELAVELGCLEECRLLCEAALELVQELRPPDHREILEAKLNLAVSRAELGDLQGARELEEEVLATRTRILPRDHPEILDTMLNLAVTRAELGDLAGALELEEEVLAARMRTLPADHPDILDAKLNLAVTRAELGDLTGARRLEEEVLAARTRTLPADHPDLIDVKLNQAVTQAELGDAQGARELEEEVLAAHTRLLPRDHPELLDAQLNLATTKLELGDLAGVRALVADMLEGLRERARGLRAEAVRPAREGARAELGRLFEALALARTADPDGTLDAKFFAALEALRLASVASAAVAHALTDHPELAELAAEIQRLRARLNDLVSAGAGEGGSREWRTALLHLTEERDRAQGALNAKLAEAGVFEVEVDAETVSARLAPDAAVFSFLRYPLQLEKDPATGVAPPDVDSLLAFVLRPGLAARSIELGPAVELEQLVRRWRAGLGKPIERGLALPADKEETEADLARELRVRLLDPLLAAAGEGTRELHVVLDDFLHLVPLDALALEGQARVGERFALHVEPTLGRLLRASRSVPAAGTLVALGGIDFEAEPAATREAGAREDTAATPREDHPSSERAGRPAAFQPLRQTRYEVEDVAEQYRETFECEPVELTRDQATKAALSVAGPGARWLHIATHGWFAPESFRSHLDTLTEAGADWSRASETLTGFAPETLCGLALAGANRGSDASGRVPGILTAEELAGFDLRGCELAVLSACETNVGIRRAGQGIQSLQSALHSAGVRTAITSLWKVDDAATRRLFEHFYTKLWREELGKHEALWQAKMALRAEGNPPRDWAGWVLSGAP